VNIIHRWTIKTKSDAVYVKIELKNYFKHNHTEYVEFYLFALMELTTNLIKYTKGGEIWLLETNNYYSLVALDKDKGIESLELAQQKGFTTANNSLGLGLFQIRQNSKFNVEIYTSTQENESGTIVLVQPKEIEDNIVFLSKPYFWSKYNGDFFVRKGRFALLGDASGHGIKANKTANFISKSFLETPISCENIDSFYENIHNYLKNNNLRSSILVAFEINRNRISLCGMGNFGFWLEEISTYKYFTLKNGIIGEALRVSDKKDFELYPKQRLIISTDGNEPKRLTSFLKKLSKEYSSTMIALCIEHFVSQDLDDASILILQHKGE